MLDAEQEVFTARVNLVRAQRDMLFGGYEVFSAVGRMTAGGLGLSTTPYNEQEYYGRVRDRWFGANIDR